jgi:hypothetical protein
MSSQIYRLRVAIPDSIQNAIIAIGDNMSRDKWLLGDLTIQIKIMVRDYGIDVTMPDVYRFVAGLTSEQVSARMIEYYASLSGFYMPEIREAYGVLTHSHFAKARVYEDHWRDCLEFMLSYMDDHNNLPSVDWVEQNYHPDNIQMVEQLDPEYQVSYVDNKVRYLLHSIKTNLRELTELLVGTPYAELANRLAMLLGEIESIKTANIDK